MSERDTEYKVPKYDPQTIWEEPTIQALPINVKLGLTLLLHNEFCRGLDNVSALSADSQEVEFKRNLLRVVDEFREFNVHDEPYQYDLIGFGEWLSNEVSKEMI